MLTSARELRSHLAEEEEAEVEEAEVEGEVAATPADRSDAKAEDVDEGLGLVLRLEK